MESATPPPPHSLVAPLVIINDTPLTTIVNRCVKLVLPYPPQVCNVPIPLSSNIGLSYFSSLVNSFSFPPVSEVKRLKSALSVYVCALSVILHSHD